MKKMKIKCSKTITDNIDKFDKLIRTAQKAGYGYKVSNNEENKKIIKIFTEELIEIENGDFEYINLIKAYKINDEGIFFVLSTGNSPTTKYSELDVINNIKKLKQVNTYH